MITGLVLLAVAQASVATDLWRVAQGTLVRPAALGEAGSATFWTPAIRLDSAVKVRVGIDAVHAPSETGVEGGVVSVSFRTGRFAIMTIGYGRMGIADVAYTETSPEAIGSSIPIWSQSAAIGVSLDPGRSLTAGASLRFVEGRLGPSRRTQAGIDLGLRYRPSPRLELGAATLFFDPTFGSGARGTVYSLGGTLAGPALSVWGAEGVLSVRYGSQLQQGESAQQLLLAALGLGRTEIVWGAGYESAYGESTWRSRFGVALGAGSYRVEIGRDGGANGFGATWRFGLMGEFR